MAQTFIGRTNLPLGLRNNNVGNLRPLSNDTWQGQIGVNQGFVVFDDVAWGIRAFATNLYTSITKYKTDTLRKYINRYAPQSENDTTKYLNHIVDSTNISADEKIPTDIQSIKNILRSQMEVELGKQYADMVTDADIDEGLSRLNSPAASFFSAVGVFYKSNKKKINYTVIGAIIIGLSAYTYFLYKKGLLKK